MSDCLVTYIEKDNFDNVDDEAIMQSFQNTKVRWRQLKKNHFYIIESLINVQLANILSNMLRFLYIFYLVRVSNSSVPPRKNS